jgi:hypothetical protein
MSDVEDDDKKVEAPVTEEDTNKSVKEAEDIINEIEKPEEE